MAVTAIGAGGSEGGLLSPLVARGTGLRGCYRESETAKFRETFRQHGVDMVHYAYGAQCCHRRYRHKAAAPTDYHPNRARVIGRLARMTAISPELLDSR